MGILLSRFRKKQTTYEILEGIDKEINRLQKNRKVNQDRQKQFVTSLLIYSIIVYVIAAVIFFCVYFPDTWKLRLLYSLPLLVFPVLIWGIKKLLHWYFVKRISSNDLALQHLRERKKQILEDVMETETYKRAREILEKFDPTRLRKLEVISPEVGQTGVTATATPGTVVQQRTVRTTQHLPSRLPAPASPSQSPTTLKPKTVGTSFATTPSVSHTQIKAVPPQVRTPAPPQVRTPAPSQPVMTPAPSQLMTPISSQIRTPLHAQLIMRSGFSAGPPGVPMPRSILPRERGTMDKLMDYLVGDGPENRFALICQICHSHNGMALKEEFEYLSFRCCYCYSLNPAKKQRPLAPKLEFFAPAGNRRERMRGATASNEESDDDDVDSEDDYSDHDSLESDTSTGVSPTKPAVSPADSASASTGVSPTQPAVSPADSASASSKSTLLSKSNNSMETSKPKEVEPSSLREAEEKKTSPTKLSCSQTEGQAPKGTPAQASTGIPVPQILTGQISKLPTIPPTKLDGRESSKELKDISQTSKTLPSEKSGLPRLVPVKTISDNSKYQPDSQKDISVSPVDSTNSTSA